jgi:CheY-like chemotaxis protein
MPRMDGLEVLRRIRADEAGRELPVVVLTSSEHQEDREAAMRAGMTRSVTAGQPGPQTPRIQLSMAPALSPAW